MFGRKDITNPLDCVTIVGRFASKADMERLLAIARITLLAAGSISLNGQEPTELTQNSESVYSVEKEAALGKQLAAELQARVRLIDSPDVQNFIESVGQSLAAKMPTAQHAFRFRLIADGPCRSRSTHEPVALPGGYIFVPTALFLSAQDEAEFAGMLAHAMEHIAERHAVREVDKAGRKIARIPLIFTGGWGGNCSEGVGVVPLGLVEAQRSFELDADSRAVQAMAGAGFDPHALLRYIERVPAPSVAASQKYTPLPMRDARIVAMRTAIEKLPVTTGSNVLPSRFSAAQEEVRRLAEEMSVVESARRPPSLRRKQP